MVKLPVKTGASLGAVLALTAGCFWAALQNGYVWDDWILFVHNPALRLPDVTWATLSAPVMDGTTYFRPLVFLTFWAEFQSFGIGPATSHAINLGIHLMNVALVFFLGHNLSQVRRLGYTNLRAAIAAGIYGIHPSVVEGVAWVSGRFDLLVTTFVLLALVANARLRGPLTRPTLLALFFAGALGSKESGIALPFALLIHQLIVDHRPNEKLLAAAGRILLESKSCVVALGAVLAAYLSLRYMAFDTLLNFDSSARAGSSWAVRLPLIAATLIFYVKEIVYPFTSVGPLHPVSAEAIRGIGGMINCALSAGLLGLLLFTARKKSAPALLLTAALVSLLPVLQIVPITIANNLGQDRFLILPLVFCALALASSGGPDLSRSGIRVPAIAMIAPLLGWVVCSALITHTSATQWKNDFTLWTWAYQKYPDSPYAKIQVTSASIQAHRYDIAHALFKRFRDEGPLEASLQLNYGGLLIASGDLEEGRKYIEGALLALAPIHKMSPEERASHQAESSRSMDTALAYRMLALVDLEQGRFKEALENADTAIWYKPNYPLFMSVKAMSLIGLDRVDEASSILKQAAHLELPSKRNSHEEVRARFVAHTCSKDQNRHLKVCGHR